MIFRKAELAYKLEGIYKEQARLRQLSKLKNVKENCITINIVRAKWPQRQEQQ